jgi:hypothetical protein
MNGQAQTDANNNVTPQVQLVGTQAVIRVGDRMYALPAYETGYTVPPVVPPTLDATKSAAITAQMPNAAATTQGSRTQSPFLSLDLPTLEAQWNSKKEELRYVEQTEVLQADHQGPVWRNQMIAKKKSLILEIDALRKQISAAKQNETSNGSMASGMMPTSLADPTVSATAGTSTFVPPYQPPLSQGLYPGMGLPFGMPATSPFQPLMMCPPYGTTGQQAFLPDIAQYGRENQFLMPTEGPANGSRISSAFNPTTNPPHSPGSAGRRSHAVPIKKPQDDGKKQAMQNSTLDPKSPTYEPAMKAPGKPDTATNQVPPTPSPTKSSPWHSNGTGSGEFNKREQGALSQKPSLSSIDTTDFFPTNTHEHSSTRIAPNKLSKQPSRDSAVPATPDKPWSTGPWNPPSAGQTNRSGLQVQNDATMRLTSWPEAFGKQGSLPSSGSKQVMESGSTSSTALRKSSVEQTGTEMNWPPIDSKPVSHVPSTYQEGYQAGLQHTGLPDNNEVLKGYIDGLVTFLQDRNYKDRKDRMQAAGHFIGNMDQGTSSAQSSLRGYLSATGFRDSAVSFAENLRSAKANTNTLAAYRQPTITSSNGRDGRVTYTIHNEATREAYVNGGTGPVTEEAYLRKSPVNDKQSKVEQGKYDFNPSSAVFPRQVSGNQFSNRMYGNSSSMQRYFPSPKEIGQGFGNPEAPGSARLSARQRFSGLDGAMDDLAGLAIEPRGNDRAAAGPLETRLAEAETDASCFKSSSAKGKQISSSPTRSTPGNNKDASSPAKVATSPKKAGEHSPAKAKLEHVTNKLRRPRKDDPRTLSPEDKQKRTEKWRGRFRQIKAKEEREIREYIRDNPRKNSGESARR